MNALGNKLRDQRGASMLLGLLFLLFCLTVGAVVLTAASVSAGRTARNRQVQQNYLAVQSAANLLMDDMEDMTFTDTYTHTEVTYHHYTTYEDGTVSHWTTPGADIDETKPVHDGTKLSTDKLTSYLEQMFLCQEIIKGYNGHKECPTPYQTTLSVQEEAGASPDDTHKLPAVTVALTFGGSENAGTAEGLEAGYTVTAEVCLTEPGPEGDHKIMLVMEPEVVTTGPQLRNYWAGSSEERDETTFTCAVTWKVSQVTKSGKGAGA